MHIMKINLTTLIQFAFCLIAAYFVYGKYQDSERIIDNSTVPFYAPSKATTQSPNKAIKREKERRLESETRYDVKEPVKKQLREPVKECKNTVAVHEAAHYIVYLKMCADYSVEPLPYKLTIVPSKTYLGSFKYGSTDNMHINLVSALAGHAAEFSFFGTPTLNEIKNDYGNDRGTDVFNAIKICQQHNLNLNEEFQKVVYLTRQLKTEINQKAVELNQKKVINF